MRVKWLSSAALLALIASPSAFAQQVSTNEPFTLKVSGSSRAAAVMLTPTKAVKEEAGKINSLGMASRTRLKINADATVNGLGYGAAGQIDLKDGKIGLADVANLYVSPYGMGKITVGVDGWSTDYAAFDSGMAFGSNFGPDGGWGASATGFGANGAVMADIVSATGGTDQGGMWDGGTKLSYATPNLAGLTAIVAFETSDDSSKNNGGDFSTSGKGYQNIMQAGAGYTSPEMGGVSVTLGGAFLSGTAKTTKKGGPKQFADLSLMQGRVAVSGYGVMAQFTYLMGGKSGQMIRPTAGYAHDAVEYKAAVDDGSIDTRGILRKFEDEDKSWVKERVQLSTGGYGDVRMTGGDSAVAGAKSNDMSGMSGSLAYAMGPAQVGVYYGLANTTRTGADTYRVTNTVTTAIGVGASYNLAKGVQAFVGYETFTSEDTVTGYKHDPAAKGDAYKTLEAVQAELGKKTQTGSAATVGMQVSF